MLCIEYLYLDKKKDSVSSCHDGPSILNAHLGTMYISLYQRTCTPPALNYHPFNLKFKYDMNLGYLLCVQKDSDDPE